MEREPEVSELIMRAAHLLRRQWVTSLEPWQVAPHEFRALRAALDADGGARLSDIADRLRIAARSATEVVDSLEDKGLVRRVPSPRDRRAVLVEPTPTGHELADALAERRSEAGAAFLEPLTEKEVATLRALLLRLTEEATPEQHHDTRTS